MNGGKFRRPQPYIKDCRQLSKAGVEEVGLPGEENTNWLSSAKGSVLKAHMQLTLYRLTRLHLCIYKYIHAWNNNEKRRHEFGEA